MTYHTSGPTAWKQHSSRQVLRPSDGRQRDKSPFRPQRLQERRVAPHPQSKELFVEHLIETSPSRSAARGLAIDQNGAPLEGREANPRGTTPAAPLTVYGGMKP